MNKEVSNKYSDVISNQNVLGCIIKYPEILEQTERYKVVAEDFVDDLQKTVFIATNNLYVGGLKKIEPIDILHYLNTNYPKKAEKFKTSRGVELLAELIEKSDTKKLDYYYSRMKKMTLLRMFTESGVDVTEFYNPELENVKLKDEQEKWLENNSVDAIAAVVQNKIMEIVDDYTMYGADEAVQAGSGIMDLLDSLDQTPAIGLPLYGDIWNGVMRGARKKKFYLCSAPSGYGKSRNMAANAAYLSCGKMYNTDKKMWETIPHQEPTLLITTELELIEIQTMLLAFISGVDETIINESSGTPEQKQRIRDAAVIISEAPIYVEELPDFSMQDVEDKIKASIKQHNVGYIFFDYLHTSMKILEEVSRKSGGVRLREDSVLLMMSIRLKDIANEYGVFVMTGTQVNREWNSGKEVSANMIRGASAIVDKVDYAEIMLGLTEEDKEKVNTLVAQAGVAEIPNFTRSIFKNRGGAIKNGKLWCYADLGTCRIKPLFYTDPDYNLKTIKSYVFGK